MRVWHSAWSWLKLIVAAESVAGNTRTGMLTRLILRKPFQVGRAAIGSLSDGSGLRARGGDRGRETLRGWRLGAETGGDGSGLGQGRDNGQETVISLTS